ncbi:MAG: protoporphyrinogen oxidase HemJ [Alphaproteobacteria bacterium]|nr:protoporphyrinogen oxidase HemJ [Alphaproteobacteria bacterium]
MNGAYLWLKAAHVIAVIAWLAGMLYLPRLYVYHCGVAPGSEAAEMLKVMERRLLRAIVNPAMIASFVLGGLLLIVLDAWDQGWVWAKIALALGLGGVHGLFARWLRDFAADRNTRPARFYRLWNEVSTLLLIALVVVVIVKPF